MVLKGYLSMFHKDWKPPLHIINPNKKRFVKFVRFTVKKNEVSTQVSRISHSFAVSAAGIIPRISTTD